MRTNTRKQLRLVALILLCLISADATLDAACDPIVVPSVTLETLSASASAAGEQCTTFCVPDCFCCSRSLAAAVVVVPSALGRVELPAAKPSRLAPDGVRPVPYHPPLTIS